MEGLIVLAVIIFLGIPAIRFFASSVPSTSAASIDDFQKRLPEGYGYPYYLDGTGHAVNVKDKKLLIESNGRKHIYGLESIRGLEYSFGGEDQWYNTGKTSVMGHINTGLKNRSAKQDAYNKNGIFVKIADIDTPVLQIKYSEKSNLLRSWEILQQFMDGTLIDYEEYLKRRQ